jgi:hypothetical protein
MTRHQRRKLANQRKERKAELLMERAIRILQEETVKRNMMGRKPERSGCLGNRGIYQAQGMFPAPGFSSGAFKEKPLTERQMRAMRSSEQR